MRVIFCLAMIPLLLCVSSCGRSSFKGEESDSGSSATNPSAESDPNGAVKSDPNGTSGKGTNTEENSPVSFSAVSLSALPACNDSRSGSLGYVKSEKKFYVCETGGWVAADILPNDSFQIASRWKFHVDSYAGEPDVSESAVAALFVGDIEIVKYSNGSAWFALSGAYLRPTSEDVDLYVADFSYSGVISKTDVPFQKIFKVTMQSQQRIRVKIDFSSATPTVKVAHDVNGDFENYPERTYVMSSEAI